MLRTYYRHEIITYLLVGLFLDSTIRCLASFMQDVRYLLFAFSSTTFPLVNHSHHLQAISVWVSSCFPSGLKRCVTLVGTTLITCPQPPHHSPFNIRYQIRGCMYEPSVFGWLGSPDPLLSYWSIQLPQNISSHAFDSPLPFSAVDHVPHPYSTTGFNFLKR
jgi:hypothetical protein